MKKWEYRLLTHQVKGIINSYVDEEGLNELNQLGDQGWEVVAIIPVTVREGALDQYAYVLKRPAEE